MRFRREACRWVRFNAVGAVGILLQLTVLVALTEAGVGYLVATAIAVELTILHNFLWHEAWTWRDRRVADWRRRWFRLLRFNTTTGAVSLLGNLLGMQILVGWLGLPAAPANLISVGLLGLINFLLNDRIVFKNGGPTTGDPGQSRKITSHRHIQGRVETAVKPGRNRLPVVLMLPVKAANLSKAVMDVRGRRRPYAIHPPFDARRPGFAGRIADSGQTVWTGTRQG